VPCKSERSLLSYDEYETVRVTHHPAIYDLDTEELHALRVRLRAMRNKERTLARQKSREARGKVDPRGGSFPGTAEKPARRRQVFANALKRVNKEFSRTRKLEARAAFIDAARRALELRHAGEPAHHPAAGDSADRGMRPLVSKRSRTKVDPGKIGTVSQATKRAQAARDSRAS
jgi:hypothetical protein